MRFARRMWRRYKRRYYVYLSQLWQVSRARREIIAQLRQDKAEMEVGN